ncbi:MAG: bifunctional phosphopantothenoylcysteine decarboxylase/phosphopantothenate synthase [Actinomyces graevenitzii]|uniref:Coenzyme A biosynthesis bifunctional protein CoaBC n=1 Tax=Actinomyces graevenitzii TaxID=55565 RepID=A0A9E7ARM4_9ACTO|nr:bifunctional phosphopantothenoylcysteine decarboxylase/phosphopantothenate synthase [Actinomyces graevenitzii]UQF80502.1 MAG: bifunctional phosphopantothenoylcysteine decarboxylase/phosphopantothenate synthase [Actinomyces graevenitzii]
MTATCAAPACTGTRRIVVGVSGSISAYKATFIIRQLRAAGHEVKVVASAAALKFIGESTLAALSGAPVASQLFSDAGAVEHVAIAEWAQLLLIAPASADLIAKLAVGRADDMLTTTALTTTAPIVISPAMHTQMWQHPATVANVETLRVRGVKVIEPASGRLTGKDSGPGRLPEPEQIVAQALEFLRQSEHSKAASNGGGAQVVDAVKNQGEGQLNCGQLSQNQSGQDQLSPDRHQLGPDAPSQDHLSPDRPKDLAGKHFVISAGGTREAIDPVRFLGNRSSGLQGIALARAAVERGAHVTLVAANIEAALLAQLPEQVEIVKVVSALQLRDAVHEAGRSAQVIIMCAAVADFRPKTYAGFKLKKSTDSGETDKSYTLELVENPDILAGLAAQRLNEGQVIVGFAAETGDEHTSALEYGRRKALKKGADLLAVNTVGATSGFGDVANEIHVLDSHGQQVGHSAGSKLQVARDLVELIAQRLS